MAKLVSKTYGDALFALAVEEHMVDQLYEEAQAVAQILRENTELTRLMNHPKIEKEEKVRLIEDIFKGRIGDELVGLLRMLVQKGHYKETDQVFTYFIDRVKEYKKIGTAYVTSAMELTPQQKQAVEQKLLDTTKYVQFEIHYTTDPALIGGMVIRIRDRVVDGSVRTRLEHLTRDLERIQLKDGKIYCDNFKGIVPFGGESASVVIELGETSTIKITDNSQVCERTIFK